MKEESYIKSPLNYTGGKFKLLPQILPLFPDDIDTFVDLFAGGCNVGINVEANSIVFNDVNTSLIKMYEEMIQYSPKETLNRVKTCIKHYGLSKENEEGFKQLRAYYNLSKNPLDLYVLASYSFNYQLRFNNKLEYNSSFGRHKISFNPRMESRLIEFLNMLKHQRKNKMLTFSNQHFFFVEHLALDNTDLVYCDPPYLISNASYNDGKRGFGDWGIDEERHLLEVLDKLDKNGVRFALSNVIEHKGRINDILIEWAKGYNVHYLNRNYNNCSYQGKDTNQKTVEVLITNY